MVENEPICSLSAAYLRGWFYAASRRVFMVSVNCGVVYFGMWSHESSDGYSLILYLVSIGPHAVLIIAFCRVPAVRSEVELWIS